jgi:hypothetical protein
VLWPLRSTDQPGACLCSESTLRTLQEALEEAAKYACYCETLRAQMEEGTGMLQQMRFGLEYIEEMEADHEAAAAGGEVAAAHRLKREQERTDAKLELQQLEARTAALRRRTGGTHG